MSDNEQPEGLEDFVKKVFGSLENAEEFTESFESAQMVEAWKGIYEVYLGMKSGGFSAAQANAILGSYLYHLISGIEGGN
jgi:hypothetical protein